LLARSSPDGKRVAFFVVEIKEGRPAREFRLRIVDLATRKLIDSETFVSADVAFDGPPQFYWDADSKGLFHHHGKRPCRLMHFAADTGKMQRVTKEDDIAIVAVLDKDHIAVLDRRDKRRAGILRLGDGKIFYLPGDRMIYGGRGRQLALVERSSRELVLARFELPKGQAKDVK
jgi:hypothetical protein